MGTEPSSAPLIPRAEGSPSESPSPWWKAWFTRANVIKLVIFLALVAAVLVAFLGFNVQRELGGFLTWLRDNKTIGFFIFVGVYALCTGRSLLTPPKRLFCFLGAQLAPVKMPLRGDDYPLFFVYALDGKLQRRSVRA